MAPSDPGRVLILGAGPTGLGAAYRLHQCGFENFLVVEAAETPGGLASSYVDAHGFTWDMGGHVQFSHYAYYDRVLDEALGDRWLWHDRESWIWIKGRFVPYPFQNNIHRLDAEDRDAALTGLERAHASQNQGNPPATFADWIDRTFGTAIADLFMHPYNRKVWGYPLDELDTKWMGDRVALPDIERIKGTIARGQDDLSWGPNRRFRFPAAGGTGAIWQGVARLLPRERMAFGERVAVVNTQDRFVELADGQRRRFDVILSTIPLDTLTKIVQPLPADVRLAARSLRYSSVHVLGIGLRGSRPETLATKCWMYFPEHHSPYYRVTVFSNYSPLNVPQGADYWSLMAEVCESPQAPIVVDTLRDATLRALRQDGLVPPSADVVSFWHGRARHGYPTPFVGRDAVLGSILPALEAVRVFSRGRFGGWKYEVSNQDHSFMQGVEWVNALLGGEPEVTYRDPNRANSGVFLHEPSTISRAS
jgi:protoporphyrinogen oxidase